MNDTFQFLRRASLVTLFLLLLGGFNLFGQDKSENDYIADLDSEETSLILIACKKLAEIKSKNAIQALIGTLYEHEDSRVRIGAASALGQTEIKGDVDPLINPTNALKKAIENDENNDVVYAALLAIGNLQDFTNPNVSAALKYCEKNKKDDPFIKDIVVRVRKFVEKK